MNSAVAAKPPRSVGEIDSFVSMLLAACESRKVNDHLEELLALPDEKRQATVHAWVNDLLIAQAPPDFIQAIGCLIDDRVAEKAYEVIYQCRRPSKLVELPDAGGIMQVLRGLVDFPREPIVRFIRGVAPMLPAAFIVGISLWSLRPVPAPARLVEMEPAASFRIRTPVIKAYEDAWWSGVLKNLGALCSGAPTPSTGIGFIVFVNTRGRIIQINYQPALSPDLDRALRDIPTPSFTPEQKAEKSKSLALRGWFLVDKDKCLVRRT